jgi:hypothetical protein
MYQLHHFLTCEIPSAPLEYIIREETCPSMHNFTVEIRNGSYMFQLQSLCENYKRKSYTCSLHIVTNDIVEDILALHI